MSSTVSTVRNIVFDYEQKEPRAIFTDIFDEDTNILLSEMFWGGWFNGSTLFIEKFLKEDLSINLEKLELAVTLAIRWIETTTKFDDPLSLYIGGLNRYFNIRGIQENFSQKKEEFYFIRGFVKAIAENETIKPVNVDYIIE